MSTSEPLFLVVETGERRGDYMIEQDGSPVVAVQAGDRVRITIETNVTTAIHVPRLLTHRRDGSVPPNVNGFSQITYNPVPMPNFEGGPDKETEFTVEFPDSPAAGTIIGFEVIPE